MQATQTGGGESSAVPLGHLEERVLGLLREVSYKGVANSAECGSLLRHLGK